MNDKDPVPSVQTHKLPRIYVDAPLEASLPVALDEQAAHHLRTVLRLGEGAQARLFNGRNGEWLARLIQRGKKHLDALPVEQLHGQPAPQAGLHLIFAPIKKARMDFLIEKAVELGATDLHPVLTHRGEVRDIRRERLESQIRDAAAQSERLELPKLHDLHPLDTLLGAWDSAIPVMACIARDSGTAPPAQVLPPDGPRAVLIGPEGGFTTEETALMARYQWLSPVSLGDTVLRAETAALAALVHAGNR